MKKATAEDLERYCALRGHRNPEGCFIGDGERVVRKMLKHGKVEQILCSPEWVEKLPPDLDIRVAPREKLDEISGLRLHQRLMALGRIPDPGPIRGSFLVALDDVSNAENVGAILRTCAAFGVEGVIAGPTTASPWLRRAVRVSMAAGLVVKIWFSDDLAATVGPLDAWAAHLYGERKTYTEIDYTRDVCVVLGGEADGVSAGVLAACRGSIYIPMAEGWDCLNVAASAAVVLSEAARQRHSP